MMARWWSGKRCAGSLVRYKCISISMGDSATWVQRVHLLGLGCCLGRNAPPGGWDFHVADLVGGLGLVLASLLASSAPSTLCFTIFLFLKFYFKLLIVNFN